MNVMVMVLALNAGMDHLYVMIQNAQMNLLQIQLMFYLMLMLIFMVSNLM